MKQKIIARYGEIHLKGGNRKFFINALLKNLRVKLKDMADVRFIDGRVIVCVKTDGETPPLHNVENILELVATTFGITSASIVTEIDVSVDAILEYMKGLEIAGSFKVVVNRANKGFPVKSMDFAAQCGGVIFRANESAERKIWVDVVNPKTVVHVDIRDKAYVYDKSFAGPGGLPVSVSGRTMVLLSGGIDSPVAAYLAAKRGLSVDLVHFATPPYTSDLAMEKIYKLQKQIERYCGKTRLFVVPFTEISRAIKKNCSDEFVITIMRRFMVRIAERLGLDNKADCIVTGENLAQVASQTIEGIRSNNFCAERLPILRPLITYDKQEIIEVAKKIGTYDVSVEPHPDCCTVFVPQNPSIRPKLSRVENDEQKLDVEGLVRSAVETTEVKFSA